MAPLLGVALAALAGVTTGLYASGGEPGMIGFAVWFALLGLYTAITDAGGKF